MKYFVHKLPDALVRVLVVFAVFLGGALLVRSLLPASLKEKSLFFKATVDREMAKPIHYAGSEVCAACHDEYNVKKSGYHVNLSCETCHGTAKQHADNPAETKPNAPRKRDFCTLCHAYDQSRPTGFPQINPAAHNPLKPCISCHNPHDPKPPSVPQECEGCHGEIARTKAISPHVLLLCTTCHSVPEGHKITPRAVRAVIPGGRDFCGKCHAKDSANKESPKIDLATHGERYLCWQCHYPHMPEVK
jgi:DnaJ-class molecular chaperone